MKHYNLAEFEAALADFKEAYRLRPDPVFLFNIAQCHRRLDNPADAATFYRAYLREAQAAPNRAEAERLAGEMERAAEAKAKARADAERETEARRVAEQAAREPVREAVPAPQVDATLVTPQPPPRRPLVKKAWFWGAVVGGAAAVGLAVGLGVGFGVQRNPSPSLGSTVVR
jgi:hypothetical protein